NEAMYQQYKVDRGRKDHWAMYHCPEKIAIVYEPEGGMPADPKKGVKPTAKQVLDTIVFRKSPRLLASGEQKDSETYQFVGNKVSVQAYDFKAVRAPLINGPTSFSKEELSRIVQVKADEFYNQSKGEGDVSRIRDYIGETGRRVNIQDRFIY